MLTRHRVNEERDDKSFMGAERVSRNSSTLFLKYKYVENWDIKLALRPALSTTQVHCPICVPPVQETCRRIQKREMVRAQQLLLFRIQTTTYTPLLKSSF
jgi:hypothetical protein